MFHPPYSCYLYLW